MTIRRQTHNIGLVGPHAGLVASVGLDGAVVQMQGTDLSHLLENNPRLASEMEEEKKASEDETQIKSKTDAGPAPKSMVDGKLVLAEEIAQGHVTWGSMELLISALGGKHPILFCVALIGITGGSTCVYTLQTWFLGVWGSQYETRSASDVNLYL